MKSKALLSLSFLIPFAMVFIYIWATATDLPFRDDFAFLKGGPVEAYLNGTLTFADLWRPMGTERFLGYNLLLIADVKYFSMNLKYLVFLIPFFMLASAILIYREYRESFISCSSQESMAATFFIITFIIFGLIQYEGLLFPFGLAFQYSMPFLIGSYISIDLYLSKISRKYWLPAFVIPVLTILVFGGTKVLPFILALIVTLFCRFLTQRKSLPGDFKFRLLAVMILFAVIGFIYFYRINDKNYMSFTPLSFTPLSFLVFSQPFMHPLEALRFLFASFGASVVGADAFYFFDFFSFNTIVAIGIFVVILYILSLIMFFKSCMYEKTYLPFFLIMLTLFFLTAMTMGRFTCGMFASILSHYTCVSIYGIVGMVWIFIFVLAQSNRSIFLKSLVYAGFTVIFASYILTSVAVLHGQPERKTYLENLRYTAIHVDTADIYELWNFTSITGLGLIIEPDYSEHIRSSLRILREHKLNIYRTLNNE